MCLKNIYNPNVLLVRYEDEEERKEENKPVGEQFYPLSDVPEIQKVNVYLNNCSSNP